MKILGSRFSKKRGQDCSAKGGAGLKGELNSSTLIHAAHVSMFFFLFALPSKLGSLQKHYQSGDRLPPD
jgi:hypothetical protein